MESVMFDFSSFMKPDSISFDKEWPDFRMYAIRRHKGQMYGDYPYAYHLAMVECVLMEFGFTDFHYQAAAWLHDIVEDTDVTLDHIYANYGPLVATLVYSVTGEGENRKERNVSIYGKLRKHPDAAVLKVADRIANLTEARKELNAVDSKPNKAKMYVQEWAEFKANVGPLVGSDLRSRLIWECLDTLAEDCINELEEIKEKKEKNKVTAVEEQKNGEIAESNLPQGEE
jgi:(p)ppGpp synthase/HD superfamily hydrolase